MDRVLLSVKDAAARVSVSRRTIYNWLHAGTVQHVRTAGGRVRIYADTLTHECTQWRPTYDAAAAPFQRTRQEP